MRETVLYEIFMDLQKAYDALDWDRCLEILAVYRVGPRELRILRMYWVWLTMVARAGGYYEPPDEERHCRGKKYVISLWPTGGLPPDCYSYWGH